MIFRKLGGIACSPDGSVFVSDERRIAVLGRKLDPQVATLAGGTTDQFRDGPARQAGIGDARGLAFSEGRLYIADDGFCCVRCLNLVEGQSLLWRRL